MPATLPFLALLALLRPTTSPTGQLSSSDRQALLTGASADRLTILKRLSSGPVGRLSDDALQPLSAAANDPDPAVRREALCHIGWSWIQNKPNPKPEAIDVVLEHIHDPNAGVRHGIVTTSLRDITITSDRLLQATIDCIMTVQPEFDENIAWHASRKLKTYPKERIQPLLEPYIENAKKDPSRAVGAYMIYFAATSEDLPNFDRLAGVGELYVTANLKLPGTAAELEAELRKTLKPQDIVKILAFPATEESPGSLTVILRGPPAWRAAIDLLDASPLVMPTDRSRSYILASPKLVQMMEFQHDRAVRLAKTKPIVAATQGSYASTFRALYDHLGKTYPNFAMKGIDWKAVGDELLPRAADCKTERDFGLLCLELVARLQDSHAQLLKGSAEIPDPELPSFDPGITCLVGDAGLPVIYNIDPNSPAAKAGLVPGLTLTEIDDMSPKIALDQIKATFRRYYGFSSGRVLEYDAVRALFSRPTPKSKIRATFTRPDNSTVSVELEPTLRPRYRPRLPVPQEGIPDSADLSFIRRADDIGYIYVRRINDKLEASLDKALTELGHNLKGLIIDVRGNSGGGFNGNNAVFNFSLIPLNGITNVNRPRYTGPIAILTDERTISAAEGWTSFFVANKRAHLFGTTTAGASSAKMTYRIENGMYQVIVPTRPYTGYLTRPIELQGLEPNTPLRPSAKDIYDRKDTVLLTAHAWLLNPPPTTAPTTAPTVP